MSLTAKIGTTDVDSIKFDNYINTPDNYRFDFRDWEINDVGHDIEVDFNRIIIKKFKPNVWIVRSPIVTGSQNHAICEYCAGTLLSVTNLSRYSNIFTDWQMFQNNHGAGNDVPGFKGFCPYPIRPDTDEWMQTSMYTWENTWTDADTKNGPAVADWNSFRLGSGGHGRYGIWTDFINKECFPSSLYDFNTWGRNPANNVSWHYGFMLATKLIQNFDDTTWRASNEAIVRTKQVTITNRIAENATGKSYSRWTYTPAIKVKVTGMQADDRLEYAAGMGYTAASDSSITQDGIYDLPALGNGNSGACFKLYGNTTTTEPVTLEIVNDTYPDGIIDISDAPIIIEQPVIYGVNITTVECWDVKDDAAVYHKDKTFANCWQKYGFALPYYWKYKPAVFGSNDNIEWMSATMFRVINIPADGITFKVPDVIRHSSYDEIELIGFQIRVSGEGVAEGVNIAKFTRSYTNCYNDYDQSTNTWSNPTPNSVTNIALGTTNIEAVKQTIYKKNTDTQMSLCEGTLEIGNGSAIENTNLIFEFIPIVEEKTVYKVSTNNYKEGQQLIVPPITDIYDYIAYLRFSMQPTNTEIWDSIKEWFANNIYPNVFEYTFTNSNISGELTINLMLHNFIYGIKPFFSTFLTKINFIANRVVTPEYKESYISSYNSFFENAVELKEITCTTVDNNYLGSGADVSNMFNTCGIETYPWNLISWNGYHYDTGKGKYCHNTLGFCYTNGWGHYRLKSIPVALPPSEDGIPVNFEDEHNIINPSNTTYMFYDQKNLEFIGPIINMFLVNPNTEAGGMFHNCNKLATCYMKYLNHGDWHFDGTANSNGHKHGNLIALNADSVNYLFTNITDLNTHDPDKHINNINTNFNLWNSEWVNTQNYTPNADYYCIDNFTFGARKRYADAASAPFICYTNNTEVNTIVEVRNLQSGDKIVWVDNNNTIINTFTFSGQTITIKTNGNTCGFKLISTNTDNRTSVYIGLVVPYDTANPNVNGANLYCPVEWEDKVTDDNIRSANAKAWNVYFGGVIKEV